MNIRFLLTISTFVCTLFLTQATQAQIVDNTDDGIELLVPVPEVPSSIVRLDERCNYILDHFWDNFNYKNAFSARKRFEKTMGTYFAFTPYATADTVHMTIDRLIKGFEKARPQLLLDLCETAEHWTYGDSAQYSSDEMYYPFVEAVVKNKKAKGPKRARYELQYRQMQNSRIGSNISDYSLTRPDGSTMTLADIKAPHILLMFVDPGCTDCLLAKARLSADYVMDALVKNDIVAVLPIYVGDPNDVEWLAEAASMPEKWIPAANAEADLDFEIPNSPTIYYAYNDGTGAVVKAKKAEVHNVLNAFHSIMQNASVPTNTPNETVEPATDDNNSPQQ